MSEDKYRAKVMREKRIREKYIELFGESPSYCTGPRKQPELAHWTPRNSISWANPDEANCFSCHAIEAADE